MRPIKFRAWDGEFMIKQSNLDEISVQELRKGVMDGVPTEGEQTKIIVMQYTGLKDRNDKEIYEGDIVKVLEKGTWYTCKVAYGLCGFFLVPLKAHPFFGRLYFTESENNSKQDDGVEVIGNIYENKELLSQVERN